MADLLALALRAIDDADARVVLADVLLETDWWDDRLTKPGFTLRAHARALPDGVHFFKTTASPHKVSATRARAIAAVLLFGEWSTAMWPGVVPAYTPPPTAQEILRHAYAAVGISELAYQEPPLYGLLRKGDPARLAGMRVAWERELDDISTRLRDAHSRIVYAPPAATGTDDDG